MAEIVSVIVFGVVVLGALACMTIIVVRTHAPSDHAQLTA